MSDGWLSPWWELSPSEAAFLERHPQVKVPENCGPGYLADLMQSIKVRYEGRLKPMLPEHLVRIKEFLDREWEELYGTEPNPYHLGEK